MIPGAAVFLLCFGMMSLLFLQMHFHSLRQEGSFVDIRQHSAELNVAFAEGLVSDSERFVVEYPHFFAIRFFLYEISLFIVVVEQELDRVARFKGLQAFLGNGQRIGGDLIARNIGFRRLFLVVGDRSALNMKDDRLS